MVGSNRSVTFQFDIQEHVAVFADNVACQFYNGTGIMHQRIIFFVKPVGEGKYSIPGIRQNFFRHTCFYILDQHWFFIDFCNSDGIDFTITFQAVIE